MDEITRIKSMAAERDVTMNSLCRAIGRSSSYFADKRRTGGKIPDSAMEVIAARLGTTAAYLRGETDDPEPPRQGGVLEADLKQVLETGENLNSAGRRELIRYGEYLMTQEEYRRPTKALRAIRHYLVPAAAGYASPVEGEDYETIELADVPPGTDFCVTVAGDSMEPYIADGSLVFVQRGGDLKDLDVGVFFLDGDVLIKQVVTDPYRNVYLLSANADRQDANRYVPQSSASTLICFGKVLGHKLPRPSYM